MWFFNTSVCLLFGLVLIASQSYDNIPSYSVRFCVGVAVLCVASVERHYLLIRDMKSNDKDDTQSQFQRS